MDERNISESIYVSEMMARVRNRYKLGEMYWTTEDLMLFVQDKNGLFGDRMWWDEDVVRRMVAGKDMSFMLLEVLYEKGFQKPVMKVLYRDTVGFFILHEIEFVKYIRPLVPERPHRISSV